MPQPKNHFLRVFVPTLLSVVAVGFAFLVFRATTNKPTPTPDTANSAAETSTPPPAAGQPPITPPVASSEAPTPKTEPAPPAQADGASTPADQGSTPAKAPSAPMTGWQVQYFPLAEAGEPGTVGALEPGRTVKQRVTFADVGAGIDALVLADHFQTIKDVDHISLQETFAPTTLDGVPRLQSPFSAFQLGVSEPGGPSTWLNVRTAPAPDERVWRRVPGGKPGEFECFILDSSGNPALRIIRTYSVKDGSFDVALLQRIFNLSDRSLTVVWKQFGPNEMDAGVSTYGGDKRKMRFGYLLDPSRDPTRLEVVTGDHEIDHSHITGKITTWGTEQVVWPTEDSTAEQHTLAWVGITSRYFGVAVHSLFDTSIATPEKSLVWLDRVSTIVPPGTVSGTERASMVLTSKPLTLAAGASVDVSLGIYAGPMDRRSIRAEALLGALNLDRFVVYNFGGMCGFCTFSILTKALLGLLHFLHDVIFRDWALAIIFLVVIVRTCLHPVTRWSQIRMQRFGKQMQAVGPKQKILQEKYGKDPRKLQEETAKLWREEGISPAGMLGCLPMFLQTPVWIALYAVLFFAVELRHEHAFFGLFQSVQPQTSPFWWFLGDLAEPDRFWYFAGSPEKYIKIPILSTLMGPVGSLNILPLILGVVFFMQQKYLTPPTAATMTPEQEAQQKMIKWMTVLMFPLFMYNAPSGLALYFIANSVLGILESRWIRAHITANDLLTPPKPKGGKPAAPTGFFARMQALAEQKQREALEKSRQSNKRR